METIAIAYLIFCYSIFQTEIDICEYKHTLQILHRNKAVVLEYPAEKKGLINFAT